LSRLHIVNENWTDVAMCFKTNKCSLLISLYVMNSADNMSRG